MQLNAIEVGLEIIFIYHIFCCNTFFFTCPIIKKSLLHDILHIGPGISPRLSYQARERSWRANMCRGLIAGTMWKISCHNLFILRKKIFELTNCENKSLRELPLFNLQIFLFRVWFQKYTKQCRSVQ